MRRQPDMQTICLQSDMLCPVFQTVLCFFLTHLFLIGFGKSCGAQPHHPLSEGVGIVLTMHLVRLPSPHPFLTLLTAPVQSHLTPAQSHTTRVQSRTAPVQSCTAPVSAIMHCPCECNHALPPCNNALPLCNHALRLPQQTA